MPDGVRLHWQEDGSANGRAVVFANSLGTDLRVWDKVVANSPPALRLVRYDMRGHGLSSCPSGPYTTEDLAADAAGLLDGLNIRNCAFVGLSIGGMVGLVLAATRPDLVGALVLSNTAARMGDPQMWAARIAAVRAEGLDAIADQILARWFSPEFRAGEDLTVWREMLIRTPAAGYVGCCGAIASADLTERTAQLTLPTLAIAGSADKASPPAQVRATIAAIPEARFALLEGAGHLPCVERPVEYARTLTDFLRETGDV